MTTQGTPDLHDAVALACLWEATAQKAGNVHPRRAFADLSYADFVASAVAIAPLFNERPLPRVGALVHAAIQRTRTVARTNTNLGMVLLLAPLAVCPRDRPLHDAIGGVLDTLTVEDSREVYRAIRLAHPGGMGRVAEEDVDAEPTLPLRAVMALAQDRDLVARQYANGFREVLDVGAPALVQMLHAWANLEDAIVGAHLGLLAAHPDSLIVRKCGLGVAEAASERARAVIGAGWPLTRAGRRAFAAFDAWLRADGHRRNPGTTADLVTACIFAALRDNSIGLPLSVPWSRS